MKLIVVILSMANLEVVYLGKIVRIHINVCKEKYGPELTKSGAKKKF